MAKGKRYRTRNGDVLVIRTRNGLVKLDPKGNPIGFKPRKVA